MVGMTVSDMDRSVDFYTRVLDFQTRERRRVPAEPATTACRVSPARAFGSCGSGWATNICSSPST